MGLIFKCPNCGIEIVSNYLRRGEQCLCRSCNTYCIVPEDAQQSGADSSLIKKIRETKGHTEIRTPQIDTVLLAGRGERLIAAFIDGILFYLLALVLTYPITFFEGFLSRDASIVLFLAVYVFTALLYIVIQAYFLSVKGQTIGKMIFHIKIVGYENFRNRGFVRNFLIRDIVNGFLCIIPFYVLIDILFIFSDDKRCLHDHIAGTIVVPVDFTPPELNPYTGQATNPA